MTEVDPLWEDILCYAVYKNKNVVKTSTVTQHVRKGMNATEAKAVLDSMTAAGYLSEPVKTGQVFTRRVTAMGRGLVP